MGEIIVPKKTLKRGQESWITKQDQKGSTQPTKLERTGTNTFNVHHEDGSVFECKVDPSKVRFAADSRKTASRFHVADDVKIRNVMSNEDRRRLGLPEDPELNT